MDDETLVATRRALHGVAELVIAGPQFRNLGSIELRVRPGGIGGAAADLAVVGQELVGPATRAPLGGSCRSMAAAVQVTVSDLRDVYGDGSGVDPDEELAFDPAAVDLLMSWFGRGDAALRRLGPELTPVLWPEHFDVGISWQEMNFGVSPGDDNHPGPYAYASPWDAGRLAGMRADDDAFWNAPFGASRPAEDLSDVDAVLAFFDLARRRAAVPAV